MRSAIERRLVEIIEENGGLAVAIASIAGIFSVFTVHVAGFALGIPRPFWSLIDSYFVTSLFLKFTLVLAFSFLLARYTTYALSAILDKLIAAVTVPYLLATPKGQRYFRITAQRNTQLPKRLRSQNFPKFLFGIGYIMGLRRSQLEDFFDRNGIAFQIISIVFVFSLFYVSWIDALATLGCLIGLLVFFPPSLFQIQYIFNIPVDTNPFQFVRERLPEFLSFKKAVLIALTASFLIGVFHHKLLLNGSGVVGFNDEVTAERIILATSSGFLLHSDINGYRFLLTQTAGNSVGVSPE